MDEVNLDELDLGVGPLFNILEVLSPQIYYQKMTFGIDSLLMIFKWKIIYFRKSFWGKRSRKS